MWGAQRRGPVVPGPGRGGGCAPRDKSATFEWVSGGGSSWRLRSRDCKLELQGPVPFLWKRSAGLVRSGDAGRFRSLGTAFRHLPICPGCLLFPAPQAVLPREGNGAVDHGCNGQFEQ